MGSNDPFENLLFIQKREYHAVKDENRTNTGPKTALPAPTSTGPKTDTAPTSTGLARPDQLPKAKTKKLPAPPAPRRPQQGVFF